MGQDDTESEADRLDNVVVSSSGYQNNRDIPASSRFQPCLDDDSAIVTPSAGDLSRLKDTSTLSGMAAGDKAI